MKTFIAVIVAVAVVACSKSDNNPIAPVNPIDTTTHGTFTPYFTCTINDTPFVASVTAFVIGSVLVYQGGTIPTPHTVTAYGKLGNDSISVTVTSDSNTIGNVGFSDGSFQFMSPAVPIFYKRDRASSGTFVVSDTSKSFAGTFSFSTVASSHNAGNHIVTNGKFELKK